MRARALATSSLGLVMLALLVFVALPRLAERIPQTLRESAQARLAAEGLAWAQVRADGRDLLLSGASPHPEDQRRAVALARGVPGVRRVVDNMRLRVVSPYRLSMDWQDGRLAVAGLMPDQASADALAAEMRAHAGAGDETSAGTGPPDLAVAAGSPPDWSALAQALLAAITVLDQGTAELVDRRLRLQGTTSSVAARERVLQALSPFQGQGYALDLEVSATVSPYTFTLAKRDGALAGRGFVPDEASRRRLAEQLAAQQAGLPEPAQIGIQVAEGAPAGWLDLLAEIVGALPRFDSADATLSDRHLTLAGSMSTTAERDRFVEALQAFEQGGFELDLTVAAADEAAVRCQARLDRLLLRPILFASGQARIDARSDALLDALADTVAGCPGARITIAGHTDDRGRPEANLLLSRQRAEAVAARLIAAGVADARITAVGYGADRPVADNATAEGRAQNRRIEFVVEVD